VTRHGLILLTVLVVVTIGALIGASVLYVANAQGASGGTSVRSVQSRALAWSGAQALMSELASQRERLLDCDEARVTDEWGLFGDSEGTGVVRLLPVGAGGEVLVSETGKLPLNTATAEMLGELPMVGDALAQRIVDARGDGFASVEELLGVEGVTPDLLYGTGEAGDLGGPEAFRPQEGDTGVDISRDDEPRGLIEVLTVFGADPNIQSGLGENASQHRGLKRVNLNTPWSDRLGRAIAQRYDADAAAAVKGLMERGTAFKVPSDIVKVLRQFKVPSQEWVRVLDTFTTTPDPFVVGVVDLNLAPAMVLACIPGIDRIAAEEIVAERKRMDAEQCKSVAWPLLEGLLTEEQFELAVDHLTTRSLQWRARVEVGVLPAGEVFRGIMVGESDLSPVEDGFVEGDFGATLRSPEERDRPAELRDRLVVDVVIDAAALRPRLSYLRDVTMMPIAASLYAQAQSIREELAADEEDDGGLGFGLDAIEPAADEADVLSGVEEGFEDEAWEGWPDSGEGLDMEPSLDFGSDMRFSDDADGADAAVAPDEGGEGAVASEEEGRDRRVGRWTTGGARG
jgi:DNA uptake protein ComE-like DNA-binding protein